MRRFLLLLVALPLLVGCEKLTTMRSNGVYVDGERVARLRSAFEGGSVAIPSMGTAHSLHLYVSYNEKCPDWKDAKVCIEGLVLPDVAYSKEGSFINMITLNDISSVGSLAIPLNHGMYEGGCESVKSVNIVHYYFGDCDDDGNQIEDSIIEINIVLNDGREVDIRYTGVTPFDGYC